MKFLAVFSSVTELMKTQTRLGVHPEIKHRIDNFFVYLEKSCASPELINQRSLWLIIYANAIRIHLLRSLSGFINLSGASSLSETSSLYKRIMRLTEETVNWYQAWFPKALDGKRYGLSVLEKIIETGAQIEEDDSSDYQIALRTTEAIIGYVSHPRLRGAFHETDDSVSAMLSSLHQTLDTLLMSQNVATL